MWVGIYTKHLGLKKERDSNIIQALEGLNQRSIKVTGEEDDQLKIIKEEQVTLKRYIKKNEIVLYNVRERTLETWQGHNHLSKILSDVLRDDIGLEYEEAEVIHRIKFDNDREKKEMERWFRDSFKMSIVDYLKLKEGINKYGFSNN